MSFLSRNMLKFNLRPFLSRSTVPEATATLHTSAVLDRKYNTRNTGPRNWEWYNKTILPPQTPDETPRPAFVVHIKKNIHYSPFKMWYVACLVRGMTVDEALRQLSVCVKKGASFARDTILEAQEMAVKNHNVEFKSNLWVAESFCGKGEVYKGIRRHAKGRAGLIEYMHSHYFVRLEEGVPPKDYYNKTVTPEEQLDKWLEGMRKRKVINSL